jgi:hypothetical protein
MVKVLKITFVPTTLVQKNLLNKLYSYVVFKQIKQHTRVKHS